MPKMPDKSQLSAPASGRTGRDMVSAGEVDGSAVGQGLKSLGQGVATVARGLQIQGEKREREDDALDLIKAENAQRRALFDTERALDADGDYQTHQKRYTESAAAGTDQAAGLIRNPAVREKWRLKADNDILGGAERMANRASQFQKQDRAVSLESELEAAKTEYTRQNASPEERAAILKHTEESIELARRSGIIPPAAAQKLRQHYVTGAMEEEAEVRLKTDPEGMRRALLGKDGAKGEVEPGNIDLSRRPIVRNADGSISTLKSMSFEQDGREILVPTIGPDGREMTGEEAIDRYRKTGEHLGVFSSPEDATAYGKRLSERMARGFMPAKGAGAEAISIRLETGKTDPLQGVGQIAADSGGSTSYGNFGLNTGGSAQEFAKEYGNALGLSGKPGTAEFNKSWKAVAAADPQGLHAAEMDWHAKNIAGPLRGALTEAGVPDALADDPRVQAYFADRSIQQGPGSTVNHAGRIATALRAGGGDVSKFLREMTEQDRANLKSDFPTALRTGKYSKSGNDTRTYGRLNMALAMGEDAPRADIGADGEYGALSPLKRAELLSKAETATRQRFEGQREQLKQQLDDDVASMRETGVSTNPELDLAKRVLEPNQVNRYFINKLEAQMEHKAVADLPALSNDQLVSRLNELAPVAGEDFFEAKQKIYDKARRRSEELFEQRDTDPARSVSDLPEVRAAAQALAAAPDDTAARLELSRARIDAQAKVGVPESRRSPITKAEARTLMAPIRGLESKQLSDAVERVIGTLEQQYGPYANAAGVAAVEQIVQNREVADRVHSLLKKQFNGDTIFGETSIGVPSSAALARQLDHLNESGLADRAFSGFGRSPSEGSFPKQYGDRLGDDAPMMPAQGDPFAAFGTRKPPQTAIDALKGNPALAGQFNEFYGPSAAEAILAEPPTPPPG